jgi:hypothetical protein
MACVTHQGPGRTGAAFSRTRTAADNPPRRTGVVLDATPAALQTRAIPAGMTSRGMESASCYQQPATCSCACSVCTRREL